MVRPLITAGAILGGCLLVMFIGYLMFRPRRVKVPDPRTERLAADAHAIFADLLRVDSLDTDDLLTEPTRARLADWQQRYTDHSRRTSTRA